MSGAIVALLLYVGVIALGFWIFYLVIKAAVRNGINESILKDHRD